ncbi:hypothetical protein VFPPC_09383 [Pochonia chlamydosporia 170]|uniref:Uncharacterized protein n=1 Tax=Pochonia chlamydosporia 170 TaxID=1380566 RepID=A0A179F895_METCM|nr:hypothetical protein VFPPC_09383 [Pochonia chlamydosporia 170]OAQ61560.1 hypothetical protein VFPPC_09383 [Pochonia chlamydosporia 170]
MPRFFDDQQMHDALRNQAIPTLASLAANPGLHDRSLRRFERDDPPPYASSTDSGDLDYPPVQLPPYDKIPDHLAAIIERPLDDREQKSIAWQLRECIYPRDSYLTEARVEERRVEGYRPRKIMIFVRRSRPKAIGVMVRHNIKRRWQKLGIWNPRWGFPGRNTQHSDKISRWEWPWQRCHGQVGDMDHGEDDAAATAALEAMAKENVELVLRALRLRQNLRRGEAVPVDPRSRLKDNATKSDAESFLLSRPWFIFNLERAEESTRYHRLEVEEQRRLPRSAHKQIVDWWKERGDWRDEFETNGCVTSWKWRHESPSPEPEDLSPIDKMEVSPLDAAEEMEFTPSEIGDLETIELSDDEQPEGFWLMPDGLDGLRGTYPGESVDVAKREDRKRRRWAFMYGYKLPEPSSPPRTRLLPPGVKLFGNLEPNEPKDATQELEESIQDDAHGPRHAKSRQSLAQKLPRQRGRRQRDEADGITESSQHPPLRRSARIAALKRPAEPMVSPAESRPTKKPRTRETTKTKTAKTKTKPKPAVATAPTPSRRAQRSKTKPLTKPLPQNKEAAPRSTRGRGRPAKDSKASTQSARVKKQPTRGARSR